MGNYHKSGDQCAYISCVVPYRNSKLDIDAAGPGLQASPSSRILTCIVDIIGFERFDVQRYSLYIHIHTYTHP